MNKCLVCEKECKNKFCSISCRNVHWNVILKKGKLSKNPAIRILPKSSYVRDCPKCGNTYSQIIADKYHTNPERAKGFKKYCSRACANSREFTDASNDKRRTTLKDTNSKKEVIPQILVIRICNYCGDRFNNIRPLKYCSRSCVKKAKRINCPDTRAYRLDCAFKFNPFHHPNILDTTLLTTHGFYSPSNKKNNLSGVSMDHKYSIRDGYDNKVDPYYMSHIMNCQLLVHNTNISKGRKSSITLDELIQLVDTYDAR